MASSSPLLEESEQLTPKKSTTSRWANMFYSTVLGKDELALSIEKIATPNPPGKPKEKNLSYLIENVRQNPSLLDDILLRFSATTNWQSSIVITTKILMTIFEILRYNRLYITKFDYVIIFLTEIRNHWKHQEIGFLERYTLMIINLSQLTKQTKSPRQTKLELHYKLANAVIQYLVRWLTNLVQRNASSN
jgi:hypothetical protein